MTETAPQTSDSKSSPSATDVGKWCDIAVEMTEEVATTTLSMELKRVASINELPESSFGGYLQLSNSNVVLLVAIAAEQKACQELARSLLFMEADEEVTADDMSDAMGEIVNMVGGSMKTKGIDLQAGLALGLPFFVEGHLEVPTEVEFSGAEVVMGGHTVWISVISRDAE